MGNRRNGKMQKQVQPPLGEATVSTPRDRNSSFDPQFIKKRETILAEGVSDRIIGLSAMGNSTREIGDWMEENLGNRVSADTISAITDRVLPEIKSWKSRMLLSIDREGHKKLLGMYRRRSKYGLAKRKNIPELPRVQFRDEFQLYLFAPCSFSNFRSVPT